MPSQRVTDGGEESLVAERFGQERETIRGQGFFAHGPIAMAADDDHGQAGSAGSEAALQLEAAHVGEAHVEDQARGTRGQRMSEKLRGRGERADIVAFGPEETAQRSPNREIVVDHEDEPAEWVQFAATLHRVRARAIRPKTHERLAHAAPTRRHRWTLVSSAPRSERSSLEAGRRTNSRAQEDDDEDVDAKSSGGCSVLVLTAPGAVPAQTPAAKPATDKPSPDKPSAQKPGVVVGDVVVVTATVEAVDKDKRPVTLKGPEGNVRTIKVDPRVKNLRQVKVGDELVIRHTEAVAIAVSK